MKKLLLTAFMALLTIAGTYASRQELTITVQGKERKYCLVKSDAGFNKRIVFMLHGLGGTYNDFDANTVQAFANINFCNVILPQALPEQDETLLDLLDLISGFKPDIADLKTALTKSAWGANVYVTIDDLCKALGVTKEQLETLITNYYPQYKPYYDAGKLQINKTVYDIPFINELYTRYGWSTNSDMYVVGFSLGGAMTFHYAFAEEASSHLKKIASASGFVSKGVTVPSNYNLPTLMINSKTDEVVPFDGGFFNRPIGNFVWDIAGERTADITTINPDKPEDEQITLMDWASNPHDRFYLVNKADHTLIDDMKRLGLNIYDVIQDFLFDTHVAADEATADSKSLTVYPNPVEDIATVNMTGNYSIINMAGVTVSKGYTEGVIDMTSVNTGRYILTIETENTVNRAIIIKK